MSLELEPIIAISPGEPAGIGPDITLQLAQQNINGKIVAFADAELLKERAQQLNIPIKTNRIENMSQAVSHKKAHLNVYHVPVAVRAQPGVLDENNARYVLDCLRHAVKQLQNESAHALLTGPIHKGIINQAGIPFTGHTEFLAELTQSTPVMMLASDSLRVALATTHLPLREVSDAITKQSLLQIIKILQHDLKTKFAIADPTILVCGLNPHAGEDGHLGHEEIEIIQPVLNELIQQGMKLIGPLPADTLFTEKYLKTADAVLAMYHDQGLPVLKHVGFGKAINITLGLPIIRTSVDHGTALDLAGSGRANSGSMKNALELAIQLANNKLSSD